MNRIAAALAAAVLASSPARSRAIPPSPPAAPPACPGEHLSDAPAPPRPPGANGPAGLRAFDVAGRDAPEPGYDWRALASLYLPGFAADAPLPPVLRATALTRWRAVAAGEGDSGLVLPELEFVVPAREIRGVYHALGVDQFRPLPAAALGGRVTVQIDDGGCEIGPRSYSGVVVENEPDAPGRHPWILAWFPKKVAWAEQRAVRIGPGGLTADAQGLALAVGGGARAAVPHADGYELQGARLATLAPSGASVLLVQWSRDTTEGWWLFEVKGATLVKIAEVVREDL